MGLHEPDLDVLSECVVSNQSKRVHVDREVQSVDNVQYDK